MRCNSNCRFDKEGCYEKRFEATATTVIDNENGLEWEKKTGKVSDGGPINCNVDDSSCGFDSQNVRRRFSWTHSTDFASGSAFTILQGVANGADFGDCFADHCDWRLPTTSELSSIRAVTGEIASPLFGANQGDEYWSVNTKTNNSTIAKTVAFTFSFSNPIVREKDKDEFHFVRLVRTR